MASTRDLAEIACSEAIAEVLNIIAAKTRVSAFNLAAKVPGACHDHPPTKNVVPGCAYCARSGNVFSGEDTVSGPNPNDIVAAYVRDITRALDNLQRDVRAAVSGEHVVVNNEHVICDDLVADFGKLAVDESANDELAADDDLEDALFRAMTEDFM